MRYKYSLLTIILNFLIASVAFGADKYQIDVAHSSIGFSVKHLVVSNIRGQFKDFSGVIMFDENDITKSSVKVTIKTVSIDTEHEKRDSDLKSAGFLDVEKYPEITFQSKSIEKTLEGFVSIGDLTIHGVTREVAIPFTLTGPIQAFGSKRIGVEASLTINRRDFGVNWSKTLDGGGLVVGNDVKISLEVEAIKAKEGTN